MLHLVLTFTLNRVNTAEADAFLRQLAQLEAPELRSLLIGVFGFQSYEGDRTIKYFNQSGHGLSVIYLADRRDRDPFGAIKEVRRGPDLTESDLTRLRELYDVLNGPQAYHLDPTFHFSHRRVSGWWRYRDQFQILPPPSGAPVPNEMLGDWPFLVEARFRSPDQGGLASRRRMQTRNDLSLLLPVLLIGPTYQPAPYSPRKHWVLSPLEQSAAAQPSRTERLLTKLRLRRQKPDPPGSIGRVVYAQEYYYSEDWTLSSGPDLSATDGMDPMPVIDDYQSYYRPRGISGDEVVEVPAVLPQLLDNYYALSAGAARQYRRACYWFNMARFFWHYSTSSSFIAYVVAIESMLPEAQPHKCPECELDHHPSITSAFREFIATHVPDRPDREQFYKVRSDIAHGFTLLQFDLREEFGGFYPAETDLHRHMEELNRVCRVALVNWLMAQGS